MRLADKLLVSIHALTHTYSGYTNSRNEPCKVAAYEILLSTASRHRQLPANVHICNDPTGITLMTDHIYLQFSAESMNIDPEIHSVKCCAKGLEGLLRRLAPGIGFFFRSLAAKCKAISNISFSGNLFLDNRLMAQPFCIRQ